MKRLLLAALASVSLLLALPAQADWVFNEGPLTVVARKEGVCDAKVAAFIKTLSIPAELTWKRADVMFEGRVLKACWAPYEGAILIVDEDEAGGAIPMQAFKEIKET